MSGCNSKCPIASGKACNIVNMNDTIRYNKANTYFLYLNDSKQCTNPLHVTAPNL
jgi:hypothetical protein